MFPHDGMKQPDRMGSCRHEQTDISADCALRSQAIPVSCCAGRILRYEMLCTRDLWRNVLNSIVSESIDPTLRARCRGPRGAYIDATVAR